MESLYDKIERAVSRIRSLGGDKVRFIILYGSAVQGGMKEDSDIESACTTTATMPPSSD
jgi:predicted nucleotidyltransferase